MDEQSIRTRAIARGLLDTMLSRAIRARLVIVPVLGAIALAFAFFEQTAWRRIILCVGVALMLGMSLVEWLHRHRQRKLLVPVSVSLLLAVLAQLLVLTGSGGLFSPALPAVIIMVVVTSLLADRGTLVALLSLIIPWLWMLAFVHHDGWLIGTLMPQLFGMGTGLERGPAPWITVGMITVLVGASARVGFSLQRLFEHLLAETTRERDRSLALHVEQSRAMSLFMGEIAHELKNPLASIKGLSALLAKDVQGKSAERLAVMRGEVDRMQTTLDEFLNYSRPLVPMSVSSGDLVALVREVVRLHEGTALERGVSLQVTGDGVVRVDCDQRKIRQVVINLLQNALEASPHGSAIELKVMAVDGLLRVQVLDRGSGLAPQLGLDTFEAGITTKEKGSGLGLVVARSLTRQHGGEVELAARPGGGAIATLTLPEHQRR